MDLYIIECRKPDGSLDFAEPQPESVFGKDAITGIGLDRMAHIVYAKNTKVSLYGTNIPDWPRAIDERWVARKKSW